MTCEPLREILPVRRSGIVAGSIGLRPGLPSVLLSLLAACSSPSATKTSSVPGAPATVFAVAGDGSVTVTWKEPSITGSSGVTGYTASADPGGVTVTTTGVTATLTGLTNGTQYVIAVAATSAVGTGPATLSNIVTPEGSVVATTGLPGPPLGVLAVAGDQQATVTWSAPASTGGTTLGAYTVTVTPGGKVSSASGTTATITGLTDGTTYLFSVAATSSAGTGPAASSNPVTPEAAPGAPGAPTSVMVSAVGDGWATVSWVAPTSDGGTPIASYSVTPSGGPTVTVAAPGTSVTVSGLTDGTAYTFSVLATNEAGSGPAATSAAATPIGAPGAPVGVLATAGAQQATITWTAPVVTGGDALGNYTVTVTPGGATSSVSGTSTTVTGLTDGTTYVFSVAATTAAGAGPSAPSNAVTPEPVPGTPLAPTDVQVTAVGDGWATVTWASPESDGGSAILGYTITPSGGSPTTVPAAARSATIGGLTDGTPCTFSVLATNAVGSGPAATSSAATPIGLPGAPTGVLAVAGNLQAGVSWTAPASTGGSPLGSYVVSVSPGGATTSVAGTSTTVTGLATGTSYVISVAATNAAGTGPSTSSNVVSISASAALSTFTGTPASPSTEDTVALHLTLMDASGNPLPNWPITIATTATGVVLTHATGSTTAAGSFFASITSHVAQTVVVTAATGGLTETLSLTFTPPVRCGAAPSFATAGPLATVGGKPALGAVGDFNGDGKPDVVVTNEGKATDGTTVSVLLGSGDGTFLPPSTVTVGAIPLAAAVGDFNGDGSLDFAVANAGGNTVSVLLGNGDGSFQPQLTTATGVEPAGLAVADVNGDGRLDIVTANLGDATGNTVSVLLGNGDGTFQAAETEIVGTGPFGVAVGDFNGDGKPDIVALNALASTISVLLGNGDGTFQPPLTDAVGQEPASVAVSDFNGDGKLDVAVGNAGGSGAGSVSVLLGNGDGTFQPQEIEAVGDGPQSLVVGDFNGDGKPDIATGNYTSPNGADTDSLLLGNGDGTFQPALSETVGPSPIVLAGDLNNDGRLDLVSVNAGDGTVAVLLNGCVASTTGGLPGAPSGVVAVAGNGQATVSWSAPAVTGGGTVEGYVVTVAPGGATTTISGTSASFTSLTNGTEYVFSVAATNVTGTGPASTSNAVTPLAAPGVPAAPAAVSVSSVGDGWATVAWTAPVSNGGSPLLSYTITPSGGSPTTVPAAAMSTTVSGLVDGTACTFSVYATNAVGNGPPATSAPATPIGLPGAPVGVLAQAGNLQATVTWNAPANTGGGTLGAYIVTVTPGGTATSVSGTSTTLTGLTAGTAYVISVAATNAAGTGPAASSNAVAIVPAAALSSFTASPSNTTTESTVTLRLVLQSASGAVLSGWPVALTATGANVVLAHANGATDSTGTYVAWLSTTQAQTVQVTAAMTGLSMRASVVFASPVVCAAAPTLTLLAPASAVEVNPQGMATGDLNGDGQLDVIVSNNGSQELSVLLGDGDGSFRKQLLTGLASAPVMVAVADFNDDGRPDAAVTLLNDTVTVLLGNGDGTFRGGGTQATGNFPGSVTVGDFNADGHADVVVANSGGTTLSVLLGNGDGTLQPQVHYQAGSLVTSLAVEDLNADGKQDLVAADNGSNTVDVLIGNGDGTFQAATSYAVQSGPSFVAVADVNGDAKPDIICANSNNGTVSVLLGNGDGTFQTQLVNSVGASPAWVAAGDVNGDGKPDVVAANAGGATVSVLLGKGDGTFQSQTAWQVGNGPVAVALGDFNGDGRLDMASTNNGDNTVSVLLNNCAESTAALPGAPVGVLAVAGNQDAVVTWNPPAATGGFAVTGYVLTVTPGGATTNVSGTATTITGLSNGTPYVIAVAATSSAGTGPSASSNAVTPAGAPGAPGAPTSVTVAAVGDGWATITWTAPSSNGGSPILSYTVTPAAGVAVTVPYPATSATITGLTNGTACTFAVYATNAAGNSTAGTSGSATPIGVPGAPVDVLLGMAGQTGTVTWKAPPSTNGGAITHYAVTLTEAGSNQDGIDLITVGPTVFSESFAGLATGASYVATVAAMNSAGTGPATTSNVATLVPSATLSEITALPASSFIGHPVTIELALMDPSGTPLSGWPVTLTVTGTDVTVDHPSGTTSATGVFEAVLKSAVAQTVNVSAATTGLTQAIAVELAPENVCATSVSVQGLATSPGVGTSPVGVAVADFNLDGKLDFVSANGGVGSAGDTVTVLLGKGDGSFQSALTDAVGGGPQAVAVADLNGDGYPDIVAANSSDATVGVLLGKGDGTFQTQLTDKVGSVPVAVAIGDVNGDGKRDLVVLNGGSENIGILAGNGDGTFQAQTTVAAGTAPTGIAVGDFNNDGKLDIVAVNSVAAGSVSVLLGNGNGTFQSPLIASVGTDPVAVAVGDFNQDGDLDVVTANNDLNAGTTVSVLLGKGNGTFSTATSATVGTGPYSVTVGDFNGDGHPDIVTANMEAGTISILLGNGTGVFPTLVSNPTGTSPVAVAVGDVNGDGRLDILAANQTSNTVSVLINTCQ